MKTKMKNIYWLPILENLNIDKKYHEKVISYIETHIYYENDIYLSTLKNPIGGTTLPLAIKVISELNNLDRINFINSYSTKINNKDYQTSSYRLHFDYENVEIKQIPDLESFLSSDFCKKTIDFFNEKENEIYIYILFSDIKQNEKKFSITHRYFDYIN